MERVVMSMYLRIGRVAGKDFKKLRYPPLAQATIPWWVGFGSVLRDCKSGFKIFLRKIFRDFYTIDRSKYARKRAGKAARSR
jgi:hypothetical protein